MLMLQFCKLWQFNCAMQDAFTCHVFPLPLCFSVLLFFPFPVFPWRMSVGIYDNFQGITCSLLKVLLRLPAYDEAILLHTTHSP